MTLAWRESFALQGRNLFSLPTGEADLYARVAGCCAVGVTKIETNLLARLRSRATRLIRLCRCVPHIVCEGDEASGASSSFSS